MEALIEKSFYLIVLLIEIGLVLLIIDGIMSIIGGMLGFSWKKVLMSAAAVFGILWLRDMLKKKKEDAETEIIKEIEDG